MKKSTKYGIAELELGLFPTPLTKLEGITKHYANKANFYIKRDDMTGLALGGNKVRKLNYVLADALSKGCDTIITCGGAQSNHCAITAAAANRLGLDCHLVLLNEGVTAMKGNQVLYKLLGARVHFVESENIGSLDDKNTALFEELKAAGKKPYIVPLGASVPLGALGYVDCMEEVKKQCEDQGLIKIDRVVVTVGSCGTYAGTLLGTKVYFPEAKVIGINVSGLEGYEDKLYSLLTETSKYLGDRAPFKTLDEAKKEIDIHDYTAEGYAIPSEQGGKAIDLMAKKEGLILDPVYTGKTFGGLMDLFEKGYFKEDENILFIHTGGAASLFAFF